MKKIEIDKTWIGIVIGFALPLLFYTGYYFLVYDSGMKSINISLCVAVNLLPFYIFQKKDKNNALKGVFISTFVLALVIIYFTFFTNHLKIGF